jgi:hypothetical protein
MPENRGSVRLKLTPEQQEEIRRATGQKNVAEELEFSIMELEERIAPGHRMG